MMSWHLDRVVLRTASSSRKDRSNPHHRPNLRGPEAERRAVGFLTRADALVDHPYPCCVDLRFLDVMTDHSSSSPCSRPYHVVS